jgi:uncharacterized membrane protein YczE
MKKTFFSETAWIAGALFLALGTAMMERADFGMSTVVAPAYLLYLKVSQSLPFFSFGMAEYTLQAILLIILGLILRRFRRSYLFSFITALVYGFVLDLMMKPLAMVPAQSMAMRLFLYIAGMLVCAIGVAFYFKTYISPAAYELVVKEIAREGNHDIGKVKIIYDVTSCLIAVVLSFLFFGFGHFEGVKAGTFIVAVLNGPLISKCSDILDRMFEFKDRFRFRKYFEEM